MFCEILETLYIRANGDIPCHDDFGESLILDHVLPTGWNPDQVFRNFSYTNIRQSLSHGKAPWADLCPNCALFRPFQQFRDTLLERRIFRVQIETSLACNLRCPCCSQPQQIKCRPKPFLLDPKVVEAALRGLRDQNYTISEFMYCGQGEPLLNPRFPEIVDMVRDAYPEGRQWVMTNANVDYHKALGGRWMNQIYVAADGLFQSSYEKYRIGGDIKRVQRFMRDVPKEVNGKPQQLVWRYLLFEFNDSDAEIYEAQKFAHEIGVDLMLFVYTHSRYHSVRFQLENADSFPIYFPNVSTLATQRHYRQARIATPLEHFPEPPRDESTGTLLMIDEVALLNSTRLDVRGWFVSRYRPSVLRVRLDEQALGTARMGERRLDVHLAYPGYGDKNSGFRFSCQLQQAICGVHVLTFELIYGVQTLCSFATRFDFGTPSAAGGVSCGEE